MIFRKARHEVLDEASPAEAPAAGGELSIEDAYAEIAALTRGNLEKRDPGKERRLLELRHLAGTKLLGQPGREVNDPEPAFEQLSADSGMPMVSPADLTPELLRAAILRSGCLLVRGLLGTDRALELAAEVERAFEARDAVSGGAASPNEYYEEFVPAPPYPEIADRPWVERGGGVLAVDSPRVSFEVLSALERAGLSEVIEAYLGERPAISAQKTTLRKALPGFIDSGAWHQDGAFLGDVRALNVWLCLSHCGDDAPGLDIVPRRVDHIVETGTEGAWADWSVAQVKAEESAEGVEMVRPIFEPGDALLFDELFLHKTAAEPEMSKPRYAVESWFFGPSAFPEMYVPLAS